MGDAIIDRDWRKNATDKNANNLEFVKRQMSLMLISRRARIPFCIPII